jgi:TRAP-type C4-dicarboxylate transport system permease small subunit
MSTSPLDKPTEMTSFLSREKPKNLAKVFIGALVAIGGIALVFSLLYTYCPAFQRCVNDLLTVKEQLVYIALPLFGLFTLTTLAIYIFKKHQARLENDLVTTRHLKEIGITIAQMLPKAKTTLLVLAIMAIMALGSYYLFTQVPLANQWICHTLELKMRVWQGVSICAGVVAGLFAIFALSSLVVKRRAEKQERPNPMIEPHIIQFESPDGPVEEWTSCLVGDEDA